MLTNTYQAFYRLLETLPVVSSHEHHKPDDFQTQLTLDAIIGKSYVAWHEDLPGLGRAERAAFLDRQRSGSYFVWLQKGLCAIYGVERITPDNWDDLSAQISKRHNDPGEHIAILRETGRYRRAVQDTYWDYGSPAGHPEIFSPTMRTDMFVRSFHPDVLDHDANTPWAHYQDLPHTDFGAYLEYLEALFTRWRAAGAVALKSASAYERPLGYGPGDLKAAASVFGRPPETVTPAEHALFEETMFNWFCGLSAKLDVPFQVHMGLGQLPGSRPVLFVPTLERHPQVHFVLFHAGYPWYGEVAGLLHNYANVSADMVWAPIISPTAAIAALHQYIEVSRSSDLIAWGSDTWTSEEAVGALLAWQHVVATVLSQKVDEGYLDRAGAETLAHKLMYANAARLYGIPISA